MNILGAIRREERKLQKQAAKLQRQLNGLKAAAKVLGSSAGNLGKAQKRVFVSRGESEDFRSREKTMGKSESGSKESCELENFETTDDRTMSSTTPLLPTRRDTKL
jgi:hypothetical protein